MTYINFRKDTQPGIYIDGVPTDVYNWVMKNIENPDWDEGDYWCRHKGIWLDDEDAIILKLKFNV